jgi:hypothetical protein
LHDGNETHAHCAPALTLDVGPFRYLKRVVYLYAEAGIVGATSAIDVAADKRFVAMSASLSKKANFAGSKGGWRATSSTSLDDC